MREPQTALNRIAQAGYEAYAEQQGWASFNGLPLPQWEDVRDDIQAAWEVAVQAIVDAS